MAAYTCVNKTPPGWNGPIMLYDGDPSMAPSCPASHPTLAYTWHGDLMPQPAMCGACTCTGTGVTCNLAPLALDDTACATQLGTVVQPAQNQCGPIQAPAGLQAITAATPTAISGACMPGGGSKTLPPAKWGRTGIACIGGGLGGGCTGGQTCAAKSEAPFVAGLCIWASGDFPCPQGFGDRHTFAGSVTDTRGCSPCACGAPSAQCTATSTIYPSGNCAGAPVDVPNDGSCVPVQNAGSVKVTVNASASCPASGGAPTGTITESGVITSVCCAP